MRHSNAEDIAIIGMACLFPGAPSLAAYWQNIVDARDCITDPPADWQPIGPTAAGACASEPLYTRKGGYLGDVSRFQPVDYGVQPASVEGAEPDQYLALRCAYEALADAGIPKLPLNREKTGVYIGRGTYFNRGTLGWIQHGIVIDQTLDLLRQLEPNLSDAQLQRLRDELKATLPPFSADSAPGLVPCLLTGRIANRLDFKGPTYTLDAACSSTLVAVDHAIRDLRSGECDAVLAGGVQVSTSILIHQLFCQIQGLSKRGTVAPFSSIADGTLLGEGCGMLLLKRRTDAERDGHRIYALLRGVGVSSDGRGAGLLAPRSEGQQLAIRRAYEQAGVSPSSIALLEAHGTGLPVGDKTELESVAACFAANGTNHSSLAVGSVKSMIGHLLPASGAASLIKTALALYHRVLPPTLHAEQAGSDALKSPLYLNGSTRPWVHGDEGAPRRAGVNAFGFGGINAHAIVEEHIVENESSHPQLSRDWPLELVVISATNEAELRQRVEYLAGWVEQAEGVSLLDIAAACATEVGACRLALVAKSKDDLVGRLRHATKLLSQPDREKIQDRSGIFWQREPLGKSGRVAFLFPGEGAQYVDMLKDLCLAFPEVRREFDITDEAFRQIGTGRPLSRLIFPPKGTSDSSEFYSSESGLSMVTTAERALTALLKRLGIHPNIVLGHSNGEFGALQAAGAFANCDKKDGLVRLIVQAAQATADWSQPDLVPDVAMITVGGAPAESLEQVLTRFDGRVKVVIDNCPNQKVLAGDEEAISETIQMLRGKGGLCERLPWNQPYHTAEFAPACAILAKFVEFAKLGVPKVEAWSCVTAAPYPNDEASVRDMAVTQLARKVRFRETVLALYRSGVRLFVEVGPRGTLSSFVSDTLRGQSHAAIPLDVMHRRGLEQLCHALAMLVAQGVSVNLSELYRTRQPKPLNLDSAPPKMQPQAPRLQQAIAGMQLSDQFIRGWQEKQNSDATTAEPSSSNDHGHDRNAAIRPAQKPASPMSAESTRRAHTNRIVQLQSISPNPRQPQTPPLARSSAHSAMVEFQQTMRQFLETQVSVTLKYHAGATKKRPTRAGAGPDSSEKVLPRRRTTVLPPFLDHVLLHEPGRRVVVETELTLERCPFLVDHAFFGRRLSKIDPQLCGLPIMPFAGTLEIMAEACTLLCPGLVITALRDARTSRWLAFEKPKRRLRVEAEVERTNHHVHAVIYDLDEASRPDDAVASAVFEFSETARDLGAPAVPDLAKTDFPYPVEEIYRFLFHGPAFQGITAVEKCDLNATRCRIRQPDVSLIVSNRDARELALPVGLLDLCGQTAGMVLRDVATPTEVTLSFPNSIERVDFVSTEKRTRPMVAVSRVRMTKTQLGSDVEMIDDQGRVVLRAMNRVEELARLPADLYSYRHSPHDSHMTRSLPELFAKLSELKSFTICRTNCIGHKALISRIWFRAAAHQVLSKKEIRILESREMTPVAAVAWLLGRIAAKDALRRQFALDVCMADVEIVNGEHGEPIVLPPQSDAAPFPLSIAHKGFLGISVAADPGRFVAVGIDAEPLGQMSDDVKRGAFQPNERALIEATAQAADEPVDNLYLAAWCVKESAGKALGRGVLGRLHEIQVTAIDAVAGRFELSLSGALATRLSELTGTPQDAPRLVAWRATHDQHAIALCLIPRK